MQTFENQVKCSAVFFVILAIPALFFASVALGYTGLIPLNISLHTLSILGFILFVFTLFVSHNANYTICKIRASRYRLNSDIREKLESASVTLGGRTKSLLDLDIFLNNYYASSRNSNYVSVASSVFPMMGILGTFVAIAISMPDFSVKETEALDHEISILLSGIGSAFFASIYGILLSLIWTYFEKRGLSKIDAYFLKIKSALEHEIWSKEELLLYEYKQSELKDQNFFGALKETLNLDFIEGVSKRHLDDFERVMQITNQNFENISNHLQRASNDLAKILSEVDKSYSAISAREQIERSLADFTLATRGFEETTKLFNSNLNNSLEMTFKKIDYEIGDIVVKLADFASHVSSESKEVQESIKRYHETIEKQLKVR